MTEKDYLQYGGHPLVRSGDQLVYGGLWERYYCQISILSKKSENGIDVATDVFLAIVDTKEKVKDKSKVVKAKYPDLGTALIFAKNWLDNHEKD